MFLSFSGGFPGGSPSRSLVRVSVDRLRHANTIGQSGADVRRQFDLGTLDCTDGGGRNSSASAEFRLRKSCKNSEVGGMSRVRRQPDHIRYCDTQRLTYASKHVYLGRGGPGLPSLNCSTADPGKSGQFGGCQRRILASLAKCSGIKPAHNSPTHAGVLGWSHTLSHSASPTHSSISLARILRRYRLRTPNRHGPGAEDSWIEPVRARLEIGVLRSARTGGEVDRTMPPTAVQGRWFRCSFNLTGSHVV